MSATVIVSPVDIRRVLDRTLQNQRYRWYRHRMAGCPRCDTVNPDGYRYCGQCASPLVVVECASCGAAAGDTGQRFCGQCATPFPTVGTTTGIGREERKLATVLFADVVGFTSLAERTDPEAVARLVDRALGRLSLVVVDHGGTVDKYMGDALMAVFGVPVAHDDDAERAVAAALAMRALGGELAFSIGINSGEVMATDLGRPGAMTVIGDAVNVAARLEKAAGPGEVLCGALTAQLAGRAAVLRRRPPITLKGKREPVDAWEAVALRPPGGDDDEDGPGLVGRDTELAFLSGQWEAVRRERVPRVVVLCGAAGAGSTRLARELALVVAPDGRVIRASYPAYGPIGGARVVADLLHQLGPSSDTEVSARLRSMTGDVDPALRGMDHAALAREQVWAFARLVKERSDERPLLLIIDDMHRSADRPLELATEVAARAGDAPLLMLLVGRSDPGEWLTKFPDATTVRLRALSSPDAAALAGAFVSDKPLTPAAVDFLVERAGGNPLYLRELVATAREQGSLVDDGDRYGLVDPGAIPASLHGLLAARLDGLPAALKLVFEHVAVLGENPTAEEVEALGAPGAQGALTALVATGWLRHQTDGGYGTVDSMLREVAYETLPRQVRGELHRVAARIVSRPEERARHLERAADHLGDDEAVVAEAADALAAVGEELLAGSRHLDALRVMKRAVALGCRQPGVLLVLARLEVQAGRNDDARQTLELAVDGVVGAADAVERDHILANTATFTDPTTAVVQLQEVSRRWKELGHQTKQAWALANAGMALFNLSRMREAAELLSDAVGLFDTAGDRNGRVAASSILCLARPTDERVPAWLADALELADESGDRTMQMTTLITLSWHHFLRSWWGGPSETADAERFATRLVAVADELGAEDLAVQGLSLLSVMARSSGRLAEATAHAAAIGHVARGGPRGEPWLGWAASFAVTVAHGADGAAPPFPPDTWPGPVVAMANLVIRAELILSGRVIEALDRFDGALPSDQWPISHLTGVLQATALVLAGRSDEARPWAERASAAGRALGAGSVVRAAEALLAEIEGTAPEGLGAATRAAGIADVITLRARVVGGDTAAGAVLAEAVERLALPGLGLLAATHRPRALS